MSEFVKNMFIKYILLIIKKMSNMYLNFILKMYNYANLKSNNEDITFELKKPVEILINLHNYFPI